jgi:hypothetical protein
VGRRRVGIERVRAGSPLRWAEWESGQRRVEKEEVRFVHVKGGELFYSLITVKLGTGNFLLRLPSKFGA